MQMPENTQHPIMSEEEFETHMRSKDYSSNRKDRRKEEAQRRKSA